MVTPLLGPTHTHTLTASVIVDSLGRRWSSHLHPRDRKGRFIETFAEVRAFAKGRPTNPVFTGRVLAMNPDGTTSIEITGPPKDAPQLRGQVVHNIPSDQLENVEYKARLGQPAARALNPDESASLNDFVARIRARKLDAPDAPDPNSPPDEQLSRLEDLAEAAEDANLPDDRDAILDIKAALRGEPTGSQLEEQVKAKLNASPTKDTADHGAPPAPTPETDDTPNAAALPDTGLSPEDERALYRGVTPTERDALDAAREGAGPDPRAYYDALDKINANVEAASRRADRNPDNQQDQDRLSRLARARNTISDWAADNNLPDNRRKATTPPKRPTPRGPAQAPTPAPSGFDPAKAKADDFNKRDMPPDMAALYDAIKSGDTPTPAQARHFDDMLQHMYEQRTRTQAEADRQGPRSNEARQLKQMKKDAPEVRAWGDEPANRDLIDQGKALPEEGDTKASLPEETPPVVEEAPPAPTPEPTPEPETPEAPAEPEPTPPTPEPEPEPEPTPEPEPEPTPPARPVAYGREDQNRLVPNEGESPEDYALRLSKIKRENLPDLDEDGTAEHHAAGFAQESHEQQHEAALRRVQAWEAWNNTRPAEEREHQPPPPLMNQLRRARRLGGLNPETGALSKQQEADSRAVPKAEVPSGLTPQAYIDQVQGDIDALEALDTTGWSEAFKSMHARQIQSNRVLLDRLKRRYPSEPASGPRPDNAPDLDRPTPRPGGDSQPGPGRPDSGGGGDASPVPPASPEGAPGEEVAPGVIDFDELNDGNDALQAEDSPPAPLSPESQAELDLAREQFPNATDFSALERALVARDKWDRTQQSKPASKRRAAPKVYQNRINDAYLDLAAQNGEAPEQPNKQPLTPPNPYRLFSPRWLQHNLLYSKTDNPWFAMAQLGYGLMYDLGSVIIRARNAQQSRRSRRELSDMVDPDSVDNVAVKVGKARKVRKPLRPATPGEASAEVDSVPDASPSDAEIIRRLREGVEDARAKRDTSLVGMDTPLAEGEDSMVLTVTPVDPADPNSDLDVVAALMPALPAGFTKVPDGSPAKLLANELRNHPATDDVSYRTKRKASALADALSHGQWSAVPGLLSELKSDSPFSQDFTDSVDRQIRGMFANPATIYKQIGARPAENLPSGWDEVSPEDWVQRNWAQVLQQNGLREAIGNHSPAKIAEFMEFLGLNHPDAHPRRVYRKGDMNIILTEDYDPKYTRTVMEQLDYLQSIDGIEGEKNVLLTSYNNTSGNTDSTLGDAYAGGNMVRYDIGRVIDIVEGRQPFTKGHFKDVATKDNLLRYVVTHEWGHMRGPRALSYIGTDRMAGELPQIADDAMRRMGGRGSWRNGRNRMSGLTQYEKTNEAEFYAENYAEFVMTGGTPESRSGRAMALAAGWAQGIDPFASPAPGDPQDVPDAPNVSDNQAHAPPKINYPGDPSHLQNIHDPDVMQSELRNIAASTNNGVLREYAERLADPNWRTRSTTEARTLFHDSMITDPDISRDPVFLSGLQHMARTLDPEYDTTLNRRERENSTLDSLSEAGLLNDAAQLPPPSSSNDGPREHLIAALMRNNGTPADQIREMYPGYQDDAAYDQRIMDAHALDESLRVYSGKYRTSWVPASSDDVAAFQQKKYTEAINADFPADGTPEQQEARGVLTDLYNTTFPEGTRRFEVDGSFSPITQTLPDPGTDPNAAPRIPDVAKPGPAGETEIDDQLRRDGVGDRAISLMKEFFRGRIEKAKRGVGQVMLQHRSAVDADGNEVRKGDIIWMGPRSNQGGGRTEGAKRRPDADGYVQNIVYARDKNNNPVLDANGRPIVSEIVVRHFDPAYRGSQHAHTDKKNKNIPWPFPFWDYRINYKPTNPGFKKMPDSSPRAQAVIEDFGLHGRRLAGGQAGRFAPSIGKVNRLSRMGRVKPIQNRFAYDSNGRLVGEGDIVRYRGGLYEVVRPNNPWNNGGNPRVRLEPLGGGKYAEPAASQVEYVDDPKNEVYFRGAGGQAAPQPQDVADTMARRGFPIPDDVRDALRSNDINALAKAIAANPDVQGFLEKELEQREDLKDRIEIDNRISAGQTMPGDHTPVTPEEYAKKRQDMSDAVILNAASSGLFASPEGTPRRVNDKVQRDLYGDYVGAERDVAMRRAFLDLYEDLDNFDTSKKSGNEHLAKPIGDAYALLGQIGDERLDTPQGRENIRRTLDKMDSILDTQGDDPTGLGPSIANLRETYGLWEAEKLATPDHPLPDADTDTGEGDVPTPEPEAPEAPEVPGLPAPEHTPAPEAPAYTPTAEERAQVGQRIDGELMPQFQRDIAEHVFDPDDEDVDEHTPEEVIAARERLAKTLASYKRNPMLRAIRAREDMQRYREAVEQARDAGEDSPAIDKILSDIDAWEARLDEITNFDQPMLPEEPVPSPRRRTPTPPPAPAPTPEVAPVPEVPENAPPAPTPPTPAPTPPSAPRQPYQGNAKLDLGFPEGTPQARAVDKLYRGAPLSSSERTNLMRATRETGARAQQELLRPITDARRAELEQQIRAAQDVIMKLTSGRRPR